MMMSRFGWPVFFCLFLTVSCGQGGGSGSQSPQRNDTPIQSFNDAVQVDNIFIDAEPTTPSEEYVSAMGEPVVIEDFEGLSTLQKFYSRNIENYIVQSKCINCHVSNGVSKNTRLVFAEGPGADRYNELVFQDFVNGELFGKEIILNKVRGVDNHGGGSVLSSSTEDFLNLENYLSNVELEDESDIDGVVIRTPSGEQLPILDEVERISNVETLRRASLMLAGRLPTTEEKISAAESETTLRATVRNLMQGEAFHEYLIRSANDILLTDAFFNGKFFENTNPFAPYYPGISNPRYDAFNGGDRAAYQRWARKVNYAVIRAPLELIAYVVENDLPYTEILTADYTMVNPQSSEAFRSGVHFETDDFRQFKPGRNRGQIVQDDSYSDEYSNVIGLKVTSHSGFVLYPHAGILNEVAFLNRYPSSDTNRNRARAKTVFKYFLGVDIEKSAGRTTDPIALADRNNPTLNNPACTVCHQVMDPVAGAFQNYGNEGWYRSSWGGLDALSNEYKFDWAGDGTLYQQGDTWYRDMLAPGYGDKNIYDSDRSLQILAHEIIHDPRFAKATVKFWWKTLMSSEVLEPPENSQDENFAAKLSAFEAQDAYMTDLAERFAEGINGGRPFNVKDMLAEMVLSDWFRARSVFDELDGEEKLAMDGVGAKRLLKPYELDNKTRSILGFAWGEYKSEWEFEGRWSMLNNRYRTTYGGIDSVGIIERVDSLNTLMSNVALTQAIELACPTVIVDYSRDVEDRKIFQHADFHLTPTTLNHEQFEIQNNELRNEQSFSISDSLEPGVTRFRISFDNPMWDTEFRDNALLVIRQVSVKNSLGEEVLELSGKELKNYSGFSRSMENGRGSSSQYWDPSQGRETGYVLWRGFVDLELSILDPDYYTFEVSAYRKNVSRGSLKVSLSLNKDDPFAQTAGEIQIRQQLQYMHELLLGEAVALNSWEIDNAYALLVELWQSRQDDELRIEAVDWGNEECILPHGVVNSLDLPYEYSDPQYMKGTWISMLIYFMTDYNFLHE